MNKLLIDDVLTLCTEAQQTIEHLLNCARQSILKKVSKKGKISSDILNSEQFAVHGFSWLAIYVEGLRQILAWAKRLESSGELDELEILIVQAAYGEYLNQIAGGISISQTEIIRPTDIGIESSDINRLSKDASQRLRVAGNTAQTRSQIATLIANGNFGKLGLEDDTFNLIHQQITRFINDQVTPYAHEWHLKDELIPIDIINQMSKIGVFGITIPEEFGGLGMGKMAMCVVTEELARGYIGVGSLGTRSEIAAELIRLGGTTEQKQKYLPGIASGDIIPTAVFTEPNTGSDLSRLETRAKKEGTVYKLNGNKTWITHAARSDLMTLLARTKQNESGYQGLSMFIAEKPRSDDIKNPFPADGMSGNEIGVLGYRGMKEYDIAFDDYEIPVNQLLGEREGKGFKQLMATFESARIQTAARSVGVAQNALELGLNYAQNRPQFGQPIYNFPRVSGKLAWMTVETMVARQLSYFSARKKDAGSRCDIEAGMAKLLAAKVAWSNADTSLQIHGGNGYALEYPISRVLCDARILNIFEGTSEIQAQVIARGLLSNRN